MSKMDELLEFVASRMPHGTNVNEIQDYLQIDDKDKVKNLIQKAIDASKIYSIGQKRGLKYVLKKIGENGEVSNDPNVMLNEALKNSAHLSYSESTTTEPVIKFKEPKNLREFIQNGYKIITHVITFDKAQNKNIVAETKEVLRKNYFSVKLSKGNIVLSETDVLNKKTTESVFQSYGDLKEALVYGTHYNR